jgi:FKBP-type peptidyl-prolyl cis-trans isomerase SlyD
MKITNGLLAELDYALKLEDGTVVESSADGETLVYLHGNEELPALLEAKLEGAEPGTAFDLTLEPKDAFGEYDVEALTTVPRSEFPEGAELEKDMSIQVGVELEGEEGVAGDYEIDMRVVEINPDSVVLDANHPLAGKTVLYSVEVRSVKKPSKEELAEYLQHCCGEGHDHGPDHDCTCEH